MTTLERLRRISKAAALARGTVDLSNDDVRLVWSSLSAMVDAVQLHHPAECFLERCTVCVLWCEPLPRQPS